MTSAHPTRIRRVAVLASLFAAALGGMLATHASGGDEVAALEKEAVRLRSEVDRVYLDVEADFAKVRAPDWGKAPFAKPFEETLAKAVATAAQEAKSCDAGAFAAQWVKDVAEQGVEAPLRRPTLLVAMRRLAKLAASGDPIPAAHDAFVSVVRGVFRPEKVEDAWDASFLDVPEVAAYRTASEKVLAQQKGPPPISPPPAESVKPEPPRPGSAGPDAEKPLDDEPVLCSRTRPWLGPWTGWTTDIPEKSNKRVQRYVKPVWIDRHEVTCAQYAAFVNSLKPAERGAMLPAGWKLGDDGAARAPEGRDRHPVSGVTWKEASAYAESQGKRLPTVDEWERAAAGGEKDARSFPWGASDEGKSWAHAGTEPKGTFPVDKFTDDATPEGIVGMAGNVAEMTSSYSDRSDVPKAGPEKGRHVLVCGGSYTSRASECATSWRWAIEPDASSPSVGLRCVMDESEYRKRRK